ncbi:oxidoreductase [Marinobacterium zhoushanense]|uniref:Oxidoreductase n=1 Tax=Marinobacterium zhoushanense TaxID=1679163 RepID=A0ABQ1K4B6_9GAMM|nr:FAD-dependent oxidoreductase [Marinobacterium zhoushanense]GGB84978.1 oxidoreductase [Marinobacterium zhoushanense]
MTGVVIIGGGHAGFQCVDSLRKGGYAGPIALVDADPHLPYQRPPLSKGYLLEGADPDTLLFRTAAYYSEQSVNLHLGVAAAAIDRERHTVQLSNGLSLSYDQLVLAPGASIRPLRVTDEIADQVHYIKALGDIDRISAQLGTAQDLVVVGGGFIGLEFAATARKLGKNVSVLVRGPRIMNQNVTPELSGFMLEQHRAHGADIQLNTSIETVSRLDNGSFEILTTDGRTLSCDMLVAGIGVTPDTRLAEAAGLECDEGIVVDASCRTNDPAIFAAGDAVSFAHPLADRRIRIESVQNAVDQAKVIAANICGERAEYDSVPWFWSDQYEFKLQMAGLHQGYDRVVQRGTTESGKFTLFLYRGERLIAVHTVNKPADHMAARKLLAAGISPSFAEAADESLKLNGLLKR